MPCIDGSFPRFQSKVPSPNRIFPMSLVASDSLVLPVLDVLSDGAWLLVRALELLQLVRPSILALFALFALSSLTCTVCSCSILFLDPIFYGILHFTTSIQLQQKHHHHPISTTPQSAPQSQIPHHIVDLSNHRHKYTFRKQARTPSSQTSVSHCTSFLPSSQAPKLCPSYVIAMAANNAVESINKGIVMHEPNLSPLSTLSSMPCKLLRY